MHSSILAFIAMGSKERIVVQIIRAPQKPAPSGESLYRSTSSANARMTSVRGKTTPVCAARKVIE